MSIRTKCDICGKTKFCNAKYKISNDRIDRQNYRQGRVMICDECEAKKTKLRI